MPRITPYAIAAALSVVAAANCLPVQAASPPIAGAAADTISFEQYRDWRLHFTEERQTQIEAELAATDLSAPRHAALLRQKAYYDFFATMKAAERDRRFRERFDEIDANHDGIIDGGERAAWYDKQRAFYERSPYRHEAANEGSRR